MDKGSNSRNQEGGSRAVWAGQGRDRSSGIAVRHTELLLIGQPIRAVS